VQGPEFKAQYCPLPKVSPPFHLMTFKCVNEELIILKAYSETHRDEFANVYRYHAGAVRFRTGRPGSLGPGCFFIIFRRHTGDRKRCLIFTVFEDVK
jgi:hypothetical protein